MPITCERTESGVHASIPTIMLVSHYPSKIRSKEKENCIELTYGVIKE